MAEIQNNELTVSHAIAQERRAIYSEEDHGMQQRFKDPSSIFTDETSSQEHKANTGATRCL